MRVGTQSSATYRATDFKETFHRKCKKKERKRHSHLQTISTNSRHTHRLRGFYPYPHSYFLLFVFSPPLLLTPVISSTSVRAAEPVVPLDMCARQRVCVFVCQEPAEVRGSQTWSQRDIHKWCRSVRPLSGCRLAAHCFRNALLGVLTTAQIRLLEFSLSLSPSTPLLLLSLSLTHTETHPPNHFALSLCCSASRSVSVFSHPFSPCWQIRCLPLCRLHVFGSVVLAASPFPFVFPLCSQPSLTTPRAQGVKSWVNSELFPCMCVYKWVFTVCHSITWGIWHPPSGLQLR